MTEAIMTLFDHEETLRKYLSQSLAEDEPTSPAVQVHLRTLLHTLSTYVPRHVAEVALAERDFPPVWGEYVEGTLLMADISGFTAMSERLSTLGRVGAEEMTDIINRCFTSLLGVIEQWGGSLVKFGGDALLVLFLSPHHPADALDAAAEMQRTMGAFRETRTSQGVFSLQMRIGLHSGTFFALSVGDAERLEYFLTGSAVNEAAWVEEAAEVGRVYLTGSARSRSDPALPLEASNGFYALAAEYTPRPPAPCPNRLAEQLAQLEDESAATLLERIERLSPYVAADLLRRLIARPDRVEVEGEHRQVTVLFANVVGFGELVSALGPAHAPLVVDVINHYFNAMRSVIARYGGLINKIDVSGAGDKLFAIFGAPVTHEDDPERAVLAALDMQANMREVNRYTQQVLSSLEGGPGDRPITLRQRIGLNTGYVFAGNVGSERRKEYTVMGDTVNLGARLMAAADLDRDQILIGPAVYNRVAAMFEVKEFPPLRVKGKSQPVPVYDVRAVRHASTRVRGLEGVSLPLVGRQEELARLQDCVTQVRAGEGHIVSIIGEAGVGKSRLLSELEAWARSFDLEWLDGHCLSYASGISYDLIGRVLKRFLRIGEDDGEAVARRKLRQKTTDLLADEVGEVLPYLAHLLAFPLEPEWAARIALLDAEALQRRVFLAMGRLIEALARRRPVVLVVDNLQWADGPSLALLEHLLVFTERRPLLVCCLYRPLKEAGCWEFRNVAARDYSSRYTDVVLAPLSPSESGQFISGLLAIESLSDEVASLILGKAEGNPLYLQEVVRALIEQGVVVRDDHHWRLTRTVEEIDIPDTLQGVIMSRLDRLVEEARHTAQVAAVIGREFLYRILQYIAVSEAIQLLEEQLRTLQHGDLIALYRRWPELEYVFRHLLIQEVAYESLLVRRRQEIHWWVGRALETLYGDERLEEQYGLLAYHYNRSSDHHKALTYLTKAGEQAKRAYANSEALRYFTQALERLEQMPPEEQEERLDTRSRLHEHLGDVHALIGEYTEALTHYQHSLADCTVGEAEEEAAGRPERVPILYRKTGVVFREQGDYDQAQSWLGQAMENVAGQDGEAARICTEMAAVLFRRGEHETAIEWSERGLSLAQAAQAQTEMAHSYMILGNIYRDMGRGDEAISYRRHCLEIYQAIGDLLGEAKAHNNLGMSYYDQGDWDLASEHYRKSVDIREQIGDVNGAALASMNLGEVYLLQGQLDQADQAFQRSIEVWTRTGFTLGTAVAYSNLGQLHARRDEWAQALDYFQQGGDMFTEIQSQSWLVRIQAHLAEAHLGLGQLDESLTHAREALDGAQARRMPQVEAQAWRTLGQVHRRQREWSAAEQALARSLQLAEDMGGQYEVGLALREQAILYRQMAVEEGDESQKAALRERAEAALSRAVQIFTDLGALWDLDRTRKDVMREA